MLVFLRIHFGVSSWYARTMNCLHWQDYCEDHAPTSFEKTPEHTIWLWITKTSAIPMHNSGKLADGVARCVYLCYETCVARSLNTAFVGYLPWPHSYMPLKGTRTFCHAFTDCCGHIILQSIRSGVRSSVGSLGSMKYIDSVWETPLGLTPTSPQSSASKLWHAKRRFE